jgi:Protein of unknown function (DUF3987)
VTPSGVDRLRLIRRGGDPAQRRTDELSALGVLALQQRARAGDRMGLRAEMFEEPDIRQQAAAIFSARGVPHPLPMLIGQAMGMVDDLTAIERHAAVAAVKPPPPVAVDIAEEPELEFVEPIENRPVLPDTAPYGVLGDLTRAILPSTEADAAALYAHLIGVFGAYLGRSRFMMVGSARTGQRHHGNVWPLIIGPTGAGRKGTAWTAAKSVLRMTDEIFFRTRVISGLGSGEALVSAVRDPTPECPEVLDRRLVILETEMDSLFASMAREGSTLTARIRQGFDDGCFSSRTKKETITATDALIVAIGHSTPDGLRAGMSSQHIAGGTANRFLPIYSHRSKLLPHGGPSDDRTVVQLTTDLGDTIRALRATEMALSFDTEAKALFGQIYEQLSDGVPGRIGDLSTRGTAQIIRMSVLFASLAGARAIGIDHLHAALALWEYSQATIRFVFGESLRLRDEDRIVAALKVAGDGGLSQTHIYRSVFGGNVDAKQVNTWLSALRARGDIHGGEKEKGIKNPRTMWYIGRDPRAQVAIPALAPHVPSPAVSNGNNGNGKHGCPPAVESPRATALSTPAPSAGWEDEI